MSVNNNGVAGAPATDEPIGSLSKRLIAGKMPDWLKHVAKPVHVHMRNALSQPNAWFDRACLAHPDIARQLVQEYGTHRQTQDEVARLLKQLPDLRQFATQQLTQAIKQRFDLVLDVNSTYLFNARRAEAYRDASYGDPIVQVARSFRRATQSLLHSALQNFEAEHALPGGLDTARLSSRVLDSNAFVGVVPSGNRVEISPTEFAALSRELDIGGQYQTLIEKACQADPQAAKVFGDAELSTLRLELHRAYLGERLEQPLYTALLKLVEHGEAEYEGRPLGATFLQLFGSSVTGALIFGVKTGPSLPSRYPAFHLPFQHWLVTYLPGARIPLKHHSTAEALQSYLRDQLGGMTRRQLLDSVPARDSSAFFTQLLDCLQPVDWSTSKVIPGQYGGTVNRVRDPNARVTVAQQPFGQGLREALVEQKRQRLRDDALFHAAPTATEDRITAQKQLAYYTGLAFDALALGVFFVPALGPVMLGLTAVQLGHEVYEGFASWARGDRQQALAYMVDVVENVAQLAALGVWEASSGKPAIEKITVETPSFVEELEPVRRPDGEVRLWSPDLKPFAHDIVLPAGLKADEFGLYHHAGKTWLALEDCLFSVRPITAPHDYALVHPQSPQGYQPRLRHNGAGAWLHGLDRPQAWPLNQLANRAGQLAAEFDKATLAQILEVSATDESVLRRVVSRNLRLPALLEDTLSRFKLARDLRTSVTEPHMLRKTFQKRYDLLYTKPTARGAILRQRYPQLPLPVIDELLRNSAQAELQGLDIGRISAHLAGEARIYQQQVRLARAYEGLYLDAARNWDTDCLILHTLEQLPGWSADMVIELEQPLHWPVERTRIGAPNAEPNTTIHSMPHGYIVGGNTSAQASEQVYDSLYSALMKAIPASTSAALGGSGVNDSLALKRLLRSAPRLSRAALRTVLRMQDVRKGFHSPMRLADGRLGYPLGGTGGTGGGFTRHTLLRMIRETGLPVHTTRTADQILADLEGSGLSRSEINIRLQALLEQYTTLRRTLAEWRQTTLSTAGHDTDAIDTLHERLLQHWYDNALPVTPHETTPLRLEQVALDTFPTDLPTYFSENISHLQLIDPSHGSASSLGRRERLLTSLLQQFPGLRSLEVTRPYVDNAPASTFLYDLGSITRRLPELEFLSITNLNMALSSREIESLRTLPRLRRLTLDGNRLLTHGYQAFEGLTLDYLGLERMELDHWPQGLRPRPLTRIREVSLRDNRIRSLPSFLMSDEPDLATHSVIALEGNPIIEDQLLRILLNQQGQAGRIHADISSSLNTRLRHYTQQREALRDALDSWANASSSTAPLSQAAMAMRNRIGININTFWRNQELGMRQTTLRLENIALEHFPPSLPPFFHQRVRSLSLARISSTSAQLDDFLRRFPLVENLSLVEHTQPSQTLPTALRRLPRLTYLSLRDMGLVIDDSVLATFGTLSNLSTLELAGNRLGTITEVPETLRNLSRLELNNMAIEQWPTWLDSLLPLELLDLSENRLTELPEHIFSNLDHDFPVSSIALFDNPLTRSTMFRARTSSDTQRNFTFAMSLPDDLLTATSSDEELAGGHLHNPILPLADDQPRLEAWLQGAQLENEALRDAWQQLEQVGDAGNLLSLVGRLQQSAPFRNGATRPSFCQRVRMVLIKALVRPQERALFNAIAQEALVQPDTGSQTCHDGALLVFQNIELLIDSRSLLTSAGDTEHTLYQELTRLYRLYRLDEIAREKAKGRDEAEVRLAYRRGLNQELKLGVPDDNMLYEAFADVSRSELTAAMDQVHRDEQGESFLRYAASNEEWCRYLRQTYAARFDAIEQQYRAQVSALDESPQSLDELAPEYEALENDKQARERHLIRELTTLANPDRS
ncbi:NEL-type E3 ubiquitin ligase domain-containing protein [Pseudomonas carassii]|uniref:RING-type E3 ubiquitin transferase n=1 Tax=Pseudomonas carassii TaxID=3115855 RepID=A0ABU7H8I0_9PSED|nr:NEL-type E3 ubiquitin ligase domain-containing protein [Pseudomonas sp. 137P]MEE1887629.1 NEL-type E3 ubiquitin ligase domain-containing protein [Pseudomonas sp. 137P]